MYEVAGPKGVKIVSAVDEAIFNEAAEDDSMVFTLKLAMSTPVSVQLPEEEEPRCELLKWSRQLPFGSGRSAGLCFKTRWHSGYWQMEKRLGKKQGGCGELLGANGPSFPKAGWSKHMPRGGWGGGGGGALAFFF